MTAQFFSLAFVFLLLPHRLPRLLLVMGWLFCITFFILELRNMCFYWGSLSPSKLCCVRVLHVVESRTDKGLGWGLLQAAYRPKSTFQLN